MNPPHELSTFRESCGMFGTLPRWNSQPNSSPKNDSSPGTRLNCPPLSWRMARDTAMTGKGASLLPSRLSCLPVFRRIRNVITAILLCCGFLTSRIAALPNAWLELITPGQTRVYLTDRSGKPMTPQNVLAYHKGQEDHFIVPGQISVELPPGHYRVHAERGPEHRPASVELDLRAGERRQVKLHPERWIDMNARGWYSGDLHNHRNINEIPTLLL